MSKIKPRYPNAEQLDAFIRLKLQVPEGAPTPELNQWQKVGYAREWSSTHGTAIAEQEERRKAEGEYRYYNNLAASRERGASGGDAA